jgi:uncharacterized paraquat-inducible protein A
VVFLVTLTDCFQYRLQLLEGLLIGIQTVDDVYGVQHSLLEVLLDYVSVVLGLVHLQTWTAVDTVLVQFHGSVVGDSLAVLATVRVGYEFRLVAAVAVLKVLRFQLEQRHDVLGWLG